VVADMSAVQRPVSSSPGSLGSSASGRRQAVSARPGMPAFAALVRSQATAAATTALYRNQLVSEVGLAMNVDHDGASDFDFLFGRWRVHNERLAERLVGSNQWQRFDAILECRPILGGLGNIDEFVTDEFEPALFLGMTLRLFDRATRRWSLYWASNRRAGLEPPVIGAFRDGVGRFEGDDIHDGIAVRVRFVWSDISADAASWQQAFSADGGATWETNWRMHMTRLAQYEPEHGSVR
jgi:hypothetical protein